MWPRLRRDVNLPEDRRNDASTFFPDPPVDASDGFYTLAAWAFRIARSEHNSPTWAIAQMLRENCYQKTLPTEDRKTDEELLDHCGWDVDCESPFEISMRDDSQSTATGYAAQLVVEMLRLGEEEEAFCEGEK